MNTVVDALSRRRSLLTSLQSLVEGFDSMRTLDPDDPDFVALWSACQQLPHGGTRGSSGFEGIPYVAAWMFAWDAEVRYVQCPRCRNVLPEPTDVPVYACGGCGAILKAKKKNNSTVNTTSQKPDDDSLGNQKLKQVFGDQEAGSSSNQQPLHNSIEKLGQNSDHDDPHSSNKDLDAANKAENDSIKEYLFGKQKMKQPFNDNEASSNSNQQPLVNSIHNNPRSSTELSGHEDPESTSPEAIGHNRIEQEQEQNQKQDQDRHQENTTVNATRVELEHFFGKQEINQLADDNETSCSLNQQLVNSMNPTTRTVRDSDGGSNSKSSFKSLITEKLLDTRLKKPMLLDEDDVLSSADLHRHQRFDPISLVEAKEISRFGGKSYYEYEGSVSSFEGNDNQIVGKHRLGSIKDENVNTGSNHHVSQEPKNGERDQLERKSITNHQQVSLYNNHVLNYPGRYGPRMAFSGEATIMNRRLDGGLCHHCCPQDRYLSAQLPRQHVCCHRPHHEPNNYHSPCFSALSSPIHRHSVPEFPAPDGYRHRNYVTKPVHSPKKKRYVRPIAGGSPWIIFDPTQKKRSLLHQAARWKTTMGRTGHGPDLFHAQMIDDPTTSEAEFTIQTAQSRPEPGEAAHEPEQIDPTNPQIQTAETPSNRSQPSSSGMANQDESSDDDEAQSEVTTPTIGVEGRGPMLPRIHTDKDYK
ncbi:hypothetical protein E3N88_12876 [Mikania micrantha]|uniref:Enhanced disease resistance 4-like N-terminal domain-containing protein n=1 Tax=Mikania micrantha TaxID=192012 RepID=A0A5N6P9A4_9ASTR|nr:hypothetical protein E3N88_12876 [Mikania micrantha]